MLSQPQPQPELQPQPPQPNSRMMMSRMTIQDVLLQELQSIMISFLRVKKLVAAAPNAVRDRRGGIRAIL